MTEPTTKPRALPSFTALLTPHLVEPVADDGRPGERDILLAGAYNCLLYTSDAADE